MKDESVSNLEFFELSHGRKIAASESKIKWEFIKYYTILALIFFSIYRIALYFIEHSYINLFNNFESKISNAEEYMLNINNESSFILCINIIFILSYFITALISFLLINNKYTIKKEYVKNILKVIIIIQLILALVLTFYISITYFNELNTTSIYRSRLEKLPLKTQDGTNIEDKNFVIDEYMNKINITYITSLITLLVFNALCAILCVFLEKKFLESNSI